MIQWVQEGACATGVLDRVIVATDDERIARVVRSYGGEVVLTRPDHPTGTDRIAEVAADIDLDVVVNIQGDEPFIEADMIRQLVEPFGADAQLAMTTLRAPIAPEELHDPSTVKVVVDQRGYALYFSRATIPHQRSESPEDRCPVWKHLGLYGYRRDFLLRYPSLPQTPLQRAEQLEQLRALENGYRIWVGLTQHESIGVDTESDLRRARELMARRLAEEGRR